ncbi:MAG: ATP-binding protein [Eubacteriales bacterium]|nr:ATP-binding protein [Eubacteriales bacterium]
MEKGIEPEQRRVRLLVILQLSIIMIYLISAASRVWIEYRETLVQNQKEQMLITAEILGENMGITLQEYENELEFLGSISGEDGWEGGIYEQFLNIQNSFACNILQEDENGALRACVYDTALKAPILVSKTGENKSIWQYEDEKGKKYLVFKEELDSGKKLCLAVDAEKYYEKLISDIHIGTNGYVMIKNSSGRILMHPEPEQWGIMVIEGRREMYPDLDYSSLEEMVKEQCSGNKGISEYYSYWWTDPELPRVKKISAYAPATIGEDFWVVSAVIDYDDFYSPIVEGMKKIGFLFISGLLLLFVMIFFIGKLLNDRRKASKEIVYLRELNSLLEEVQQGEERIAHQQRLQIMGTMTGGIAHEFNNFLTPIMGYAELLMLELDEESDEYDSAREIYEASEKAKDVIRQISSLSRRNVETVYKTIPADKMLQRVSKMVESVCPAHVHMKRELQVQGISILGNATQLNQVILNICVNAIYAIGKKEGELILRAETVEKETLEHIPALEASQISKAWSRYLRIDIEDNGCGMTQETLKHIFDPFFTTKKAGEGTGLGLSLAEQIVHSHKGYLYAESEVGKGTTFTVFLPVLEADTEETLLGERQQEDLRILIADDNAKILKLLERNFARIGLQITVCRTNGELQKILKERKINVLVIDETLEDGDGVDSCMAMQGKYPDILKIMMADQITREIAEAKQKRVIDGYVEKPVSDTTILEAIRSCRES